MTATQCESSFPAKNFQSRWQALISSIEIAKSGFSIIIARCSATDPFKSSSLKVNTNQKIKLHMTYLTLYLDMHCNLMWREVIDKILWLTSPVLAVSYACMFEDFNHIHFNLP